VLLRIVGRLQGGCGSTVDDASGSSSMQSTAASDLVILLRLCHVLADRSKAISVSLDSVTESRCAIAASMTRIAAHCWHAIR
jgi:hypothetical protein